MVTKITKRLQCVAPRGSSVFESLASAWISSWPCRPIDPLSHSHNLLPLGAEILYRPSEPRTIPPVTTQQSKPAALSIYPPILPTRIYLQRAQNHRLAELWGKPRCALPLADLARTGSPFPYLKLSCASAVVICRGRAPDSAVRFRGLLQHAPHRTALSVLSTAYLVRARMQASLHYCVRMIRMNKMEQLTHRLMRTTSPGTLHPPHLSTEQKTES